MLSTFATRQEIIDGLTPKPVPIDVHGNRVHLLPLRAGDRVEFCEVCKILDSQAVKSYADYMTYGGKLLALMLCDESGSLLNVGADEFSEVPAPTFENAVKAAREISGFGSDPPTLPTERYAGGLYRFSLKGLSLLVRKLTSEDWESWNKFTTDLPGRKKNSPAVDMWVASKTLVSPHGRALFRSPHELADLDGAAIRTISEVVQRVTGIPKASN